MQNNNIEDLSETIGKGSSFMTAEKWTSLVVECTKEEWQKKSKTTSKNHQQSDMSIHTGGSAIMYAHDRRMVCTFRALFGTNLILQAP